MEINGWRLHYSTLFLLLNGNLSVAETFLAKTENICLNVAASKIDKELLHQIIQAIMDGTYDDNESLKLEIFRAISRIKNAPVLEHQERFRSVCLR